MTVRIFTTVAIMSMLFLAACGGGGGTPTANMMPGNSDTATVTSPSVQDLSYSGDEGLTYSPLGFPYTYTDDGPYFLIGGDGLTRTTSDFDVLGEWNGVGIAWGRDRNGVGRSTLLTELRENMRETGHVQRWTTPPVVRVAHGTPEHLIGLTHFAVSMINTALPADWQLAFDFQPAPADADPEMPGEILITFAPARQWPDELDGVRDALGVSVRFDAGDGTLFTAPIWIDASASHRAGVLKRVIGHEILHSLGRAHPILLHTRIDTIMAYDHHDLPQMLFPIDQEFLLAVYDRLQPGTTSANLASDLGPWDDTATHLLGGIRTPDHPNSPLPEDLAIFGVRLMNGRAMPWAIGPEPLTQIWNNQALSGSANWSGRLVGFTPSAHPVGGDADMMLDLADLDGTVDFTSLEQWSAGQAPSAPGTGSMWLDGDLHYTVQVHSTNGDAFGNYTPGANDDDGILDGGFFGPSHEAAAGVLERDDLTAAFGAELQ